MSTTEAAVARPIHHPVPARLNRSRCSPFHTGMVIGLGGARILNGLQITVARSGWRESRTARIANGAADQLQLRVSDHRKTRAVVVLGSLVVPGKVGGAGWSRSGLSFQG